MDEVAHARRLRSDLERALESLPERQRAALWLTAVEGLSYAEVAAPLEPAPEPEELALNMEIENDTDLEVIEMLDWLETLGEIESS